MMDMLKALVTRSLESSLHDLSSPDPVVRQEARRKLVVMGRQAVPRLRELLKSPEEHVRWEAAKALGEIGGHDAVSGLAGALSDTSRDVRWVATEGLIAAGDEALESVLHELITHAGLVWVREAGIRVIDASLHERNYTFLKPVLDALKDRAPIFEVPIAAYEALVTLHRSRMRMDTRHLSGS